MAGVNKAILIGNLGRDPEVRYTADGRAIANFSIATSEEWTDKQSGEKKEQTEWHRIVVFGRMGEVCGEYLSKGRQVYVEGRLQTRSWEKDGVTRYTTEINASTVKFLGPRSAYDSTGPGPASAPRPQAQAQPQSQPGPSYAEPPPDDDIPF